MKKYDVLISGVLAGQIGRASSGQIIFSFSDSYRLMANRPVVGQRFEDNLRKKYFGEAGALPPFFANLIPEGPLRDVLENSLNITHGDDLALLNAVGQDLPGAIEVKPSELDLALFTATDSEEYAHLEPVLEDTDPVFRFSLAGVQLKFSVLKSNEHLLLPTHGSLGDWIVKFDSQVYPLLVENEFATMEWARESGFNVPECQILPVDALSADLAEQSQANSNVFLIKRYDRNKNGMRIHQEDFAQVAGLRPALKYDQWTYERCAYIVQAICGGKCYEDFIRRLVFMVASGNTDAHLKNWSLLYPDKINAELTPLYDQVATIAWPPKKGYKVEWALKFAGTKNLYHIDANAFERLIKLSGGDVKQLMPIVHDTLSQIADAWASAHIAELMPASHVDAIVSFWQRVPLLQSYAIRLV